MGRKTISAKQRSIPVSFSVKPALADRIEDMAYDQRFTRSKFLQEAVLRYINFIEMGGLESSENVSEMSATRKTVIGLNALQQAVREDDFSVPNEVLRSLTEAIDLYKASESNHGIEYRKSLQNTAAPGTQNAAAPGTSKIAFGEVTKTLFKKGEYTLWADGSYIGRAKKIGKVWKAVKVQSSDFNLFTSKTLKGLIEIIQISVDIENVMELE